MNCQKCEKEVFLPFRCPYCGDYFCSEHRLPENHDCPNMELARIPKTEVPSEILQKQRGYEYTFTYAPSQPTKKKTSFSYTELKHLAVAILLVVGVGLSIGLFQNTYVMIGGSIMLVVFAVILTCSFFIHEIAHKVAAQRRGLWAEFRLQMIGVILTLISIVSPLFKIISPGAVMISGFADRKTIGEISIAGPACNIVLSTILITFFYALPEHTFIFLLTAAFNAWIALFNLIPFGILDGFKIFFWSKSIWAAAFTASLALSILSFYSLMEIV